MIVRPDLQCKSPHFHGLWYFYIRHPTRNECMGWFAQFHGEVVLGALYSSLWPPYRVPTLGKLAISHPPRLLGAEP